MKKILNLLLIISILTIFNSIANAENELTNDSNSETEIEYLNTYDNTVIVKSDNKYGLYNTLTKKLDFPIKADKISLFTEKNNSEFKIETGEYKGYYNSETKDNFLVICDDIYLYDNFFKIKVKNKYGLLDKTGNTVLAPIFQKINIINDNLISAKLDGQYQHYKSSGKLIPENELYIIDENQKYIYKNDLNQQYKSFISTNQITYSKIQKDKNNKYVYEINEIGNPKIIKTNTENKKLFTIDKKNFYLIKKDGLYGLKDSDDKAIIPAKYYSFEIIKPCKHYLKPIFLAKNDQRIVIYDIKGKLLAENVYDKINIYKNGRLYLFDKTSGILSLNNTILGYFIKNENNKYIFKREKFSFRNTHTINELILSILNGDQSQ